MSSSRTCRTEPVSNQNTVHKGAMFQEAGWALPLFLWARAESVSPRLGARSLLVVVSSRGTKRLAGRSDTAPSLNARTVPSLCLHSFCSFSAPAFSWCFILNHTIKLRRNLRLWLFTATLSRSSASLCLILNYSQFSSTCSNPPLWLHQVSSKREDDRRGSSDVA